MTAFGHAFGLPFGDAIVGGAGPVNGAYFGRSYFGGRYFGRRFFG